MHVDKNIRKKKWITRPDILLSDTIIYVVNSFKYLGFIWDSQTIRQPSRYKYKKSKP